MTIKSSEGDYEQFVCPSTADVGDEILALLKKGTVSVTVAISGSAFKLKHKLKLPEPRNHMFVILNHYNEKSRSSSGTSSTEEVSTEVTVCAITVSPEENIADEDIEQQLRRSFFMDNKYRIADLKRCRSLPPPSQGGDTT